MKLHFWVNNAIKNTTTYLFLHIHKVVIHHVTRIIGSLSVIYFLDCSLIETWVHANAEYSGVMRAGVTRGEVVERQDLGAGSSGHTVVSLSLSCPRLSGHLRKGKQRNFTFMVCPHKKPPPNPYCQCLNMQFLKTPLFEEKNSTHLKIIWEGSKW